MADTVTYEFTANHATELWSTDPAKMVDGTETSYASTTTDGDIQCLITNECMGTDLGTISKVEIRAYAYSDDNDQLILRPVFGGSADGDNHTTVPGTVAGWGDWQDITTDANAPKFDTTFYSIYGAKWQCQTFTPASTGNITKVKLPLSKANSPGTVTVSIKATVAGKPSGADLTSGTTDGDTLPEIGYEWREISLTSYELTGSTVYAIVVRALSGDLTNLIYWEYLAAGGCAGGQNGSSANSGTDWTLLGQDMGFWTDVGEEFDPTWKWADIQNLDCDVEQNDISKGNTMYCGMVQIQVTYTAEAPPAGVAVQMMHYARMRRR